MIWREVDPPSIAGELVRDLPELLEHEAESETFLDEPIEQQIARIREILGLDDDWDFDEDEAEDPKGTGADAASPADPPPRAPPDSPPPSARPREGGDPSGLSSAPS